MYIRKNQDPKSTFKILPCIVCRKELMPVYPDDIGLNQPNDALAFSTAGHYGSTVFDPMTGHCLEINVCDDCLVKAAEHKCVLLYDPRPESPFPPVPRTWDPKEDLE